MFNLITSELWSTLSTLFRAFLLIKNKISYLSIIMIQYKRNKLGIFILRTRKESYYYYDSMTEKVMMEPTSNGYLVLIRSLLNRMTICTVPHHRTSRSSFASTSPLRIYPSGICLEIPTYRIWCAGWKVL